eukprot:2883551-Rhodomonas_salina.1
MFESAVMQNFIRQQQAKETKQWVYEVLEGTREIEDVVYRDTESRFVLLPCPADAQGRRKGYIAIVADRALRCLRDLRGEHTDLLREIRDTCLRHLPPDIRHASIHYHPSVYQLHIHFRSVRTVKADDPRTFELDEILFKLDRDPMHYKKADLVYSLPPASEIARLYRQQQHAGIRSDQCKGASWLMSRKKATATYGFHVQRGKPCHIARAVGLDAHDHRFHDRLQGRGVF